VKLLDRSIVVIAVLSSAGVLAQQPPPVAATPASGPMAGARYVVDPTHTFAIYEIGHYGTSTNRGRFSTKVGSVQVDATGATATIDVTMDISSINTGVELLNRHLQSPDFFNAAKYPTGRFVAERVAFRSGTLQEVPGTLTLLGRTRPMTLHAIRFACYISPMLKRQICGGDFEAVIQRSQWGIEWGIAFGFEDKVRLLVQVEAINVR
jgi:polyisoprenoid-binding protein YceI